MCMYVYYILYTCPTATAVVHLVEQTSSASELEHVEKEIDHEQLWVDCRTGVSPEEAGPALGGWVCVAGGECDGDSYKK